MKRMMRNSGSRIPHDFDGTVVAYIGRVRNGHDFFVHGSGVNDLFLGLPFVKE
jgi:hypothetical protein